MRVQYFVHAPVVFGVPFFARELMKVIARYGIKAHFEQNLVAVDGAAKTATFEAVGGDNKGKRTTVTFDMLHVSPPAKPARRDQEKPIGERGWLGRGQSELNAACPLPERLFVGRRVLDADSKTAAAVRKQSPIVVHNLLHMIAGTSVEAGYDGYASCPLTTAYGETILAEFIYGGKVTPTLPLDPAKEHWIGWWIKVTGLPIFYWNYMLKGHEWFFKHDTAFKGDAA